MMKMGVLLGIFVCSEHGFDFYDEVCDYEFGVKDKLVLEEID